MISLVATDIHQNIDWLNSIIKKESPDHVFLLGDFFDTHEKKYDHKDYVIKICEFLKENLDNPKFTILQGNHDNSYHFSKNPYLKCSGFDIYKWRLINSIIKAQDWAKFKFFAWHNDYLLTHAGLSKTFVRFEPNKENINEFLVKSEIAARLALEQRGQHWFFGAGYIRGGTERYGGIFWNDWDEFLPLKDIEGKEHMGQIFGHTHGKQVRQIGNNYCIDVSQTSYIIFNDDKLEVKNLY